jgi:hypothetical protein
MMVPGSNVDGPSLSSATAAGRHHRMTEVSFRHRQLVCHFLERLQLHLLAAVYLQQGFPIDARLLKCVRFGHPFPLQQFRKGSGTRVYVDLGHLDLHAEIYGR